MAKSNMQTFSKPQGIPEVPEDQEEILAYWSQSDQCYIVLSRQGNVLLKNYWDGYHAEFSKVEADIIIDRS